MMMNLKWSLVKKNSESDLLEENSTVEGTVKLADVEMGDPDPPDTNTSKASALNKCRPDREGKFIPRY